MGKSYPAKNKQVSKAVTSISPEEVKEQRALSQLYSTKHADRFYNKLDPLQKNYYEAIIKYPVTCTDEPSGTGKTTIGFGLAGLEFLRRGLVDKLIYLRFPDDEGEKLGFTPGDLKEKESKYMQPAYDALMECGIQPEAIEVLKSMGLIEMTTDATLRGVNLKGTFLFIDESQNGSIKGLQKVLTRLHDHRGRAVIAGHSGQCDTVRIQKYGSEELSPFQVYQRHMTKKGFAVSCPLKTNYRGQISQWADRIGETIAELTKNEQHLPLLDK